MRFDVVGEFWGQLELDEHTRIRNVNRTGVLVDSSVPAALGSAQTLRVAVDGQPLTVNACVRHVRPAGTETGVPRYFIGMEFVSAPDPVLQSIEALSEVTE